MKQIATLIAVTLTSAAFSQKASYVYIKAKDNNYAVILIVKQTIHMSREILISAGKFKEDSTRFLFKDSGNKFEFIVNKQNPRLGFEFGDIENIQEGISIENEYPYHWPEYNICNGWNVTKMSKDSIKLYGYKNIRENRNDATLNSINICFSEGKYNIYAYDYMISSGSYDFIKGKVVMHDRLRRIDFDMVQCGNLYYLINAFPFSNNIYFKIK